MGYNTLGLFHSIKKKAAVVRCCYLTFLFAANSVKMLLSNVKTSQSVSMIAQHQHNLNVFIKLPQNNYY